MLFVPLWHFLQGIGSILIPSSKKEYWWDWNHLHSKGFKQNFVLKLQWLEKNYFSDRLLVPFLATCNVGLHQKLTLIDTIDRSMFTKKTNQQNTTGVPPKIVICIVSAVALILTFTDISLSFPPHTILNFLCPVIDLDVWQ